MEKIFRLQKTSAWIFLVMTVLMFIQSLVFMSDFKDLFGLMMRINEDVAYFHDTLMQGYNQRIFISSVLGLLVLLVFLFLQAFSRVPDRFALAVITLCLVALTGFSVYEIIMTGNLERIYFSLDFSNVAMEGGVEYVVRTRTFTLSYILNTLYVAVNVLTVSIMYISHFKFISYRKGADYAEA